MYQFALIQMLHNQKQDTYHPIFYYDTPLPGGFEEGSINNEVIRYKSKGHHTTGFKTRPEAVVSAMELLVKLEEQHDTVTLNIEKDIEWDGEDIPADIQLMPMPKRAV
jgi:hypothetical protein